MPEEVTTLEDFRIIQVKSRGDITDEDFNKTLASILRIGEEQGLSKVLVDTSEVTSYPATFPIFNFAVRVANELKEFKVAIVVVPETQDESRFFESAVHNRGGNIGIFDWASSALSWLKE